MTNPPEPHLRRPIAGLDPAEDRLLAMIAALASEVAMLRERLDTVERLAEAGGTLSRPEIEGFAPSPEATAERDALRKRSIEKIFRPLRDASRTLATPPAKD